MVKIEELTTVQERISFLFKQSNETQPTFASAVGIKQPHFSGIMKDRNPSRQLIARIAEHTGASVKWIAEGIGEPYPSSNESKDPEILKNVFDVTRGVFDTLELSERYELAAHMIRTAERFKREKATTEEEKLGKSKK